MHGRGERREVIREAPQRRSSDLSHERRVPAKTSARPSYRRVRSDRSLSTKENKDRSPCRSKGTRAECQGGGEASAQNETSKSLTKRLVKSYSDSMILDLSEADTIDQTVILFDEKSVSAEAKVLEELRSLVQCHAVAPPTEVSEEQHQEQEQEREEAQLVEMPAEPSNDPAVLAALEASSAASSAASVLSCAMQTSSLQQDPAMVAALVALANASAMAANAAAAFANQQRHSCKCTNPNCSAQTGQA